MKSEKLKESLRKLNPELLIDKLVEYSNDNKIIEKDLNFLILQNAPKKLAKKLKTTINALKRSTKFIDYYKADAFTNELYQLSGNIELLIDSDAQAASELIVSLFNIDKSIYERVDDSNGCIGTFYYHLCEVLAKAWLNINNPDKSSLAQITADLLANDEYNSMEHLISMLQPALGADGLQVLEEKLETYQDKFYDFQLRSMFLQIADAQKNVDKYIQRLNVNDESISEKDVCNIAKRLIDNWREAEAIDWLMNKPNQLQVDGSSHINIGAVSSDNRLDLLLTAFDAENMLEEATSLRWQLFKKSLNGKYYKGLLQYQTGKALENVRNEALDFALNNFKGDFDSLLHFLDSIQEYDHMSNLIIDNLNALTSYNYSFYRTLSKTLSQNSYNLAATLLRRQLIDTVLTQARSKIYHYAVSDLKLCLRFGEMVEDWRGFDDNQAYLLSLKKNHSRKTAFWALVEENAIQVP
jgi:hypothetical protein